MFRSVAGVVFLVSLVFSEVASQIDGDCTQEDGIFECRCEENQNFSTDFLRGDAEGTELAISDCAFAELGPGFFFENYPLQKITFRNIKRLTILGSFPSQLRELHIDGVGLEKLTKDVFSGDTRLEHLRIHNSSIDKIKQDTFELVAVENAHFKLVNFLGLEVDSLAFGFNMSQVDAKDHAEISFHDCRFPEIDMETISVAEPGKIKFVDNILYCANLAQTYDWLNQMIGEQKQKGLLCHYLDGNFCESKRDSNRLIRKLFASGLLSNKLGTRLQDSCPDEHQQYVDAKMSSNPNNAGRLVCADFLVLLLCFGVMLMGK